MVSILISIIQHEQYYLMILLIDLKGKFTEKNLCLWSATLLKKTLAQMFSSEFCKVSRNNFFYGTHPGDSFWIKSCKSLEVCKRTSLLKLLTVNHFNIK